MEIRWKYGGNTVETRFFAKKFTVYDEDTPALLALKFCLFTEESGSGFKGRGGVPRMNLLNVLEMTQKDIKL